MYHIGRVSLRPFSAIWRGSLFPARLADRLFVSGFPRQGVPATHTPQSGVGSYPLSPCGQLVFLMTLRQGVPAAVFRNRGWVVIPHTSCGQVICLRCPYSPYSAIGRGLLSPLLLRTSYLFQVPLRPYSAIWRGFLFLTRLAAIIFMLPPLSACATPFGRQMRAERGARAFPTGSLLKRK